MKLMDLAMLILSIGFIIYEHFLLIRKLRIQLAKINCKQDQAVITA